MKTGTITFHAPNNNGSFLQAYALQSVLLDKLHIDNEIIDFYSEQQARQYSVFRKPHSVGDIGRNLISLLHYNELNIRHKRFKLIRQDKLKLSKRCSNQEEVNDLVNLYDVVICGSDQIWNTAARDYSDAYFMTGAHKIKVSYAASFGSHIESVDLNKVKKNIAGFSEVSIREGAGKRLLNRIMPDQKIEIVCDPTLLLDMIDYEKMIRSEKNIRKTYIFLYTINYSDEVLKTAQKLSLELDMPVYAAFTGYSCVKCRKYGIKVLYDVAPAEFLWLVKNASYTCSNSFHGIVFSIIFEKQFCRPADVTKNNNQFIDDRIDGLLDQIGLACRTVSVNDNCGDLIQEPINYKEVKDKIKPIREKGLNYLKSALLE